MATFKNDEDFVKNLSKKMKQYCCPIFLKQHAYDISHSNNTPNATMTFIKYKDFVYGCTCKHVVKLATKNDENNKYGALHILSEGPLIFNLNCILVNPQTMECVSYPEFLVPNCDVDIAIKPMALNWFNEFFAEQKKVKYFDFDDYQEPDYEIIEKLHAFGWLNENKRMYNDKVETKLAHSIVDLMSKLDKNSEKFTLFSELEEEHNLSFSGMSGGPVVYCEENFDKVIPMGIIYEGLPGEGGPKNDSLLSKPKNIVYECYNITPKIFEDLLQNSDWIYKQDKKYKNWTMSKTE